MLERELRFILHIGIEIYANTSVIHFLNWYHWTINYCVFCKTNRTNSPLKIYVTILIH